MKKKDSGTLCTYIFRLMGPVCTCVCVCVCVCALCGPPLILPACWKTCFMSSCVPLAICLLVFSLCPSDFCFYVFVFPPPPPHLSRSSSFSLSASHIISNHSKMALNYFESSSGTLLDFWVKKTHKTSFIALRAAYKQISLCGELHQRRLVS